MALLKRGYRATFAALIVLGAVLGGRSAQAHDLNLLPELIAATEASIVGVGTRMNTRRPPNQLLGTGFAVADGSLVVTNSHVVDRLLDVENFEHFVVFVGKGRKAKVIDVEIVARDERHDVAVLKLASGTRLPAVAFGDDDAVRTGEAVAFTGFPIGAILGLYPVTNSGTVSAITPIAIPAASSQELTAARIKALAKPYNVFQLDATAYPGNSGSPVFDLRTGKVVAIVNRVFVKETKENVLKDPSNITYAIPAKHIRELLEKLR